MNESFEVIGLVNCSTMLFGIMSLNDKFTLGQRFICCFVVVRYQTSLLIHFFLLLQNWHIYALDIYTVIFNIFMCVQYFATRWHTQIWGLLFYCNLFSIGRFWNGFRGINHCIWYFLFPFRFIWRPKWRQKEIRLIICTYLI